MDIPQQHLDRQKSPPPRIHTLITCMAGLAMASCQTTPPTNTQERDAIMQQETQRPSADTVNERSKPFQHDTDSSSPEIANPLQAEIDTICTQLHDRLLSDQKSRWLYRVMEDINQELLARYPLSKIHVDVQLSDPSSTDR